MTFRPGDVVRVRGDHGRLVVGSVEGDKAKLLSVRSKGDDVKSIDWYEDIPTTLLVLVYRDGPAEELHDIAIAYGSTLTYDVIKESIKRGQQSC